MVNITPFPYIPDSTDWFLKLKNFPWPIFLDSHYNARLKGSRYDLFTAAPFKTFLTYGDVTTIEHKGKIYTSRENPFVLLKQELAKYVVYSTKLPFCGGAMGYFGYELEKVSLKHTEHIPDMAIGFYDWAFIVDHAKKTTQVVSIKSEPEHRAWVQLLLQKKSITPSPPFRLITPFKSNLTETEYAHAFEKIKQYLLAGDCYQVNLAMRFSAVVEGDPWFAYQKLRTMHPAPFSGYFEIPEVTLLSFSPERFLKIQNRRVITCPIKGTRPRDADVRQDRQQKKELRTSQKDQAENVMIVDLMRNDLGRTCIPGSIQVPRLFEVQSFSSVHHLVSTVTGMLDAPYDAIDLLKAAFPGGSITGAPKVRAMEIIAELEPHARTLYTGSFGYLSFDGKMDTNILIRSLIHHQNHLYAWAGGGIVADSVCAQEYQEIYDKIGRLLQ